MAVPTGRPVPGPVVDPAAKWTSFREHIENLHFENPERPTYLDFMTNTVGFRDWTEYADALIANQIKSPSWVAAFRLYQETYPVAPPEPEADTNDAWEALGPSDSFQH